MQLNPATKPTMYFIGVTTGKSSIMTVFPKWAQALELGDTQLKGIDIAIHEKPEVYREVVRFIRDDPFSLGALVTTHKIDLYNAAKDFFGYIDPYAARFSELSSISKKKGQLCAHAKDPLSCASALEEFVPARYWAEHGGDVFLMGAGGSAISMGAYFMRTAHKGNAPRRIVVSNRSLPRLKEIERIFNELNPGWVELEFRLCPTPDLNDEVLATLPPHSLVVNATGLGKDRPGSPLTDAAVFPENSLVWEINYRGDLLFMQQALRQKEARGLHVEDGWMYFIYGWTQVISEVYHTPIEGETLRHLSDIAKP